MLSVLGYLIVSLSFISLGGCFTVDLHGDINLNGINHHMTEDNVFSSATASIHSQTNEAKHLETLSSNETTSILWINSSAMILSSKIPGTSPTFRPSNAIDISVDAESYRLSGHWPTPSIGMKNASACCNTTVYRRPPMPTLSTSRQGGGIYGVYQTSVSATKLKESASGVSNTENRNTTALVSNAEAQKAKAMLAMTLASMLGLLHLMLH